MVAIRKADYNPEYTPRTYETAKEKVQDAHSIVIYKGRFQEGNDYRIIMDSEDWDFFTNAIEKATPDKDLCDFIKKPLKFKRNV